MGSPVLWAASAVKFLQNKILSPSGAEITLPSANSTLVTTSSLSAYQDQIKYAVLSEQQASNTNSGQFTSGSWQTRVINTEQDPDSIVSISSNKFIPIAGTYKIYAVCPAYAVSGHKAKLYNVTAATDVLFGQDSYGLLGSGDAQVTSDIIGTFTANGTDEYEIRHYCNVTRATNGYGVSTIIASVNEVYLLVELMKIS